MQSSVLAFETLNFRELLSFSSAKPSLEIPVLSSEQTNLLIILALNRGKLPNSALQLGILSSQLEFQTLILPGKKG